MAGPVTALHGRDRRPAGGTTRRLLRALGGPVLIVAAVLVVLRDFVFRGLISSQHPDILAFWTPTYCFLGRSLHAGHIPAWNPAVMGGVPFAADPQSGWMYLPAMVLFSLFSCSVAIRLMVVLQPALAGLGLFWFLRSEGVSRPSSTSGGMALSLVVTASRLVLFLPFPSSFAWSSLLLAALSRLFAARSWGGRTGWALGAVVAWGQLGAAHAGHGFLIGTGAAAAFIVAKAWSNLRRRTWARRDVWLAMALLAAAFPLVNLAYLAPRLAYLPHSSYARGYAQVPQVTSVAAGWPLKFATIPGAYLGAAALALCFAGFWSRRFRFLAVAFGGWGLFSYVAGLRVVATKLVPLLRHVPGLSFYQHYPGRFSLGLVLAIPVLAALGLEAWAERRSLRERALMLGPGVFVWFVLTPIAGASLRQLALLGAGAVAGGAALWAAARRSAVPAVLPALLAVELCLAGLAGQYPSAMGFTVASATDPFGADLTGWFGPLHRPAIDAAAYVRPDAIASYLRSHPEGRFLSFDATMLTHRGYLSAEGLKFWGLEANQRAMLFAIEDAQGYNPFQLGGYWSFVRAVDRGPLDYNAAFLDTPSPAVLDLLQVAYVVAPAGAPPFPGSTAVVTEGRWSLYRRVEFAPRAEGISAWRVAATADQAIRDATTPGFDPSRQVVLERHPALLSTAGAARPPPAPATYRTTSPERIEVTVRGAGSSIVLIRNTFDPGWHATVDGRPATVLRADGFLQGVAVTPGEHRVVLTYSDPWIELGLGGSAAAIAIMALGAVVLRRRSAGEAGPVRAVSGGHHLGEPPDLKRST